MSSRFIHITAQLRIPFLYVEYFILFIFLSVDVSLSCPSPHTHTQTLSFALDTGSHCVVLALNLLGRTGWVQTHRDPLVFASQIKGDTTPPHWAFSLALKHS